METLLNKTIEQLENGSPSDRRIRLKSVYKSNKITIQPVPDGMGWYKGIPRISEDDKKKLKYWAEPKSSVVIKDGTMFDLNKEEDRVTWEWVKHSSAIAETEEQCQLSDVAEFYIYVEEDEAASDIEAGDKLLRALEYIKNDNVSNYVQRAALLGTDMEGASPRILKQYLYSVARATPDRIINVYESKDISTRLLLLKAIKSRIASIDSSGMYRYGNNILGMSEDTAVAWMLDPSHKDIVELMDREANPEYYAKLDAELAAKEKAEEAARQEAARQEAEKLAEAKAKAEEAARQEAARQEAAANSVKKPASKTKK